MPDLPSAGLDAVLDRLADAWQPWISPNVLLAGMTGAGKTTLVRLILSRTRFADRVLVVDPKPSDDASWTTGEDAPCPISKLEPRCGQEPDGGGPAGLWWRLTASHDPAETARRFRDAFRIISAEGHWTVVLDDLHTTCLLTGGRRARADELGDVRKDIDDLLSLGRAAVITTICATGDLAYVPKGQFSVKLTGHLSGLASAKAAAGVLGWRGRDAETALLGTPPYGWIYADDQPAQPGPCRTALPAPTLIP